MIKVGLTGGIGSGKTTVAKIWEQMGACVVYADTLAKELMTTDPDLRKAISSAFGKDSYNADGTLNRKYLSEQAFGSGRVEELNRLVHPAVYKKTAELMEHARAASYQVFVKEAALLLKNGRPDNLDVIVLVTSSEENRIARVTERDAVSASDVEKRIKMQQRDDELIRFSDYVIKNDRDLDNLKEEARKFFLMLKSGKTTFH